MGTDLFKEILNKFLLLLQQDKFISGELAKEVHDNIAGGNCAKDSIELLLKAEIQKAHENTQA